MAVVLHWNGRDLPEGLRTLPEGTYILEAVAPAAGATTEQEDEILAALESVRDGRTLSRAAARQRLDRRVGRRR